MLGPALEASSTPMPPLFLGHRKKSCRHITGTEGRRVTGAPFCLRLGGKKRGGCGANEQRPP